MQIRSFSRAAALLLLVLGCDDAGNSASEADTSVDQGQVAGDGGELMDQGSEVDLGADDAATPEDAEPEADARVERDAAEPDAAPDVGPDAAPDAGCPGCGPVVVRVRPFAPKTGDDLVASLVEPANAMTVWAWSLGDEDAAILADTVPAARTARGQRWTVTASVDDPRVGGAATGSFTVEIGNTLPSIDGARLQADEVARAGQLECVAEGWADPDEDAEQVRFEWFLLEGEQLGRRLGDEATLDTAALFPDQQVVCVATPFDDFGDGEAQRSGPGRVGNTAPSVAAVRVEPQMPTSADTLLCQVDQADILDAEGDAVILDYRWFVGEVQIQPGAAPTLAGAFAGGDVVRCEVTPRDAFVSGVAVGSAPVEILGSPPQVHSARVESEEASACGTFRCVVNARDADGDDFDLSYAWTIGGEVVPGEEGATLEGHYVPQDVHVRCHVEATAGEQRSGVVASEAQTGVDRPPTVAVVSVLGSANAGDQVACVTEGAVDDCSEVTLSYVWRYGGRVVEGVVGRHLDTAALPPGERFECTATPNDGFQDGPPVSSGPGDLVGSGFSLAGDTAEGRAGYSVAVVGDVNADQRGEILVGAPNTSFLDRRQAGQVYLVYGAEDDRERDLADLIEGEGGYVIAGEMGSYPLRRDVCRGFNIGCPNIRAAGDPTTHNGGSAGPEGESLGFAVAAAGDVNGDGREDFLMSAPYARVRDVAYTGRATVLLEGPGLDDGIDLARADVAWNLEGECGARTIPNDGHEAHTISSVNGDLAGWAIDAGDINGDGLSDVVVTAPNTDHTDTGTIYVAYGSETPGDHETFEGVDGLGATTPLAVLDANGCRTDEVEVSEALDDAQGFGAHAAEWNTNPALAHWGRRARVIGDWNQDGYDDLLTRGFQFTSNSALMILGGPEGTDINILDPEPERVVDVRYGDWVVERNPTTVRWSKVVATGPIDGGGDVNGDGRPDIALSGYFQRQQALYGVIFGTDEPLLRLEDYLDGEMGGLFLMGDDDLEPWGGDIRITGDLNGDGYDDLVVGSPYQDTDLGEDVGRIYVAYGGPGAILKTMEELEAGVGGFVIDGTQVGAKFGWSIAVGEVDGDGLDDLIVGSPFHTVGEGLEAAGRVDVILGRDFGGQITGRGTSADDAIDGDEEADVLIGGRGADTLRGLGGPDTLSGGSGDDRLEVTGPDFHRVRGGLGFDTLVFEGDGVYELAGMRVRGIEALVLGEGGQTATLRTRELFRLGEVTNRPYVTGDAADELDALGDEWIRTALEVERGEQWRVFKSGRAELYLSGPIQTRFSPFLVTETLAVAENSPGGTAVGEVVGADPDGDVARVELLPVGDGLRFAFDEGARTLSVANNAVLDFETKPVLELRFRVTDEAGNVHEDVVEVELADVNEAPVVNACECSYEFTEGDYQAEHVTVVAAYDLDAGDTLSYHITAPAEHPFAIDEASGRITIEGALDHEAQDNWLLEVEVRDAAGLTATDQVNVLAVDTDVFRERYSLSFATLANPFTTAEDPCGREPTSARAYIDADNSPPVVTPNPFDGSKYLVMQVDGDFDLGFEIGTVEGRIDAHVAGDVVLDLPDEIQPGGTVEVAAAWLPTSTTLSGDAPGANIRGHMGATDGRYKLWYCDEAVVNSRNPDFDAQCQGLIDEELDVRKPNGDPRFYRFGDFSPVEEFAATGSAAEPWFAETPLLEDKFFEFTYPWITWQEFLIESAGLPHPGRFQHRVELDGLTMAADAWFIAYNIIVRAAVNARARMNAERVRATFIMEHGTRHSVELGACHTLEPPADEACRNGEYPTFEMEVPADEDDNGDGRVEMRVVFETMAEVERSMQNPVAVTGQMSCGYFQVDYFVPDPNRGERKVDTRTVGPQFLAEPTVVAHVDCDPTVPLAPFNSITRIGAIDLAE